MTDNCTNTIKCTLKLLKIPFIPESVTEEVFQHPDHPSLLCIADVLKEYNIETYCSPSYSLDELETPFIVPLMENGYQSFAVVKSVTNEKITVSKPDIFEWESIELSNFLTKWTNIALIVHDYENKPTREYITKRNKHLIYKTASIMALAMIGSLWLFTLIRYWPFDIISKSLQAVYYSIALLGSIISTMLIFLNIDKSSPILQKICQFHTKTNCKAVIESDAGQILGGIFTWSEIGLYYFSGIFLSISLSYFDSSILYYLFFLNIAATPYIIYSIYYQWRVLKTWCVLCIAIQLILALNTVISILYFDTTQTKLPSLGLNQIFYLLISFVLPFTTWTLIGPLVKSKIQNRYTKIQLARLRNNRDIFEHLVNKQPEMHLPIPHDMGITIGNRNGNIKLTVVSHPFCKACIESHHYIEEILEYNPNIQVQIIYFTSTLGEDDDGVCQTINFLVLMEQNDESQLRAALRTWVNSQTKDHLAFTEQYKISYSKEKQLFKVYNMEAWCRNSNVKGTPTFYINGKEIPEIYSIKEIRRILVSN